VTFAKRVVLFVHVQKFERTQIGEGVRWFTLVSGADFRQDDRCFCSFWSEAFCFFPLRRHEWLVDDWFGCHSKVLGASSVELPIAECNMTCDKQLQIFRFGRRNFIVCITKISDRFCIFSAFWQIFFLRYICDIIVQVNWMPSANWFLWSNPIRDFCVAVWEKAEILSLILTI